MKWLLIIAPIVLSIFLLLPVEIKLYYVYKDGKSNLIVSTSYLFGLFKPEMQPFDNKKNDKEKDNEKTNNSNYKEGRGSKRLEKFSKQKELINYVTKKITIKELTWKTNIGLSEPHYLSVLYGFIWWFKSLIIGYLVSKKEASNVRINITPDYNTNKFESRFNCIIKIRLVYIINIWIRLIKLYKGGEEYDRPSNRRLNENYNE